MDDERFDFTISNVVGTSTIPFNDDIDMEDVLEAIDGQNKEMKESSIQVKRNDGSSTVTIYETSSKCLIICPSENQLRETSDWLVEQIEPLVDDEQKVTENLSIDNVLGVGKMTELKAPIVTKELHGLLGKTKTEQDGEQFPSLVYRGDDYECTFQVFSNGQIISIGSSSEEQARKDFSSFVETMYDLEDEWLKSGEMVIRDTRLLRMLVELLESKGR